MQHIAILWRSTIEYDGSQLKPIGPYHAYNVFDYYCPPDKSKRTGESLPYIFLNTNAYDSEAVGRFYATFGPLGNIAQTNSRGTFPFHSIPLNEEARPEVALAALVESNNGALYFQHSVQPPDDIRMSPLDVDLFRRIQKRVRTKLIRIQKAKTDEGARRALSNRLLHRQWLRPHLAYNEAKNEWLTTWNISNLQAAIYLMLHLDLQAGGLIKSCERKGCYKWFRADDGRIVFCSKRCLNTVSIQKFRAKRKKLAGLKTRRYRSKYAIPSDSSSGQVLVRFTPPKSSLVRNDLDMDPIGETFP
jgi:hypothetical protein